MMFSPYPGPRSFNEDESLLYKGRDQYLESIARKLEKHHFLLVTGSSGDGKSSLIFAGLIPFARAGFIKADFTSWMLVHFRPKRNPLRNLAEAIKTKFGYSDVETVYEQLKLGYSSLLDLYQNSPLYVNQVSDDFKSKTLPEQKELLRKTSNIILLADQFEEFFTNDENYDKTSGMARPEAAHTVALLLETAKIAREKNIPIYIVLTMRSDYFGQCTAFSGLPNQIVESQFYLERLNRNEIIQAIEEPAVLTGNRISKRLLETLITEISSGVGLDMLPVLQHCLFQVWKAAGDGTEEMDLLQYAMVGGMSGELLTGDDKIKFDNWFKQLTPEIKELYKYPSLRNVLNIHANRLFEKAYDVVLEEYRKTANQKFNLSKEKVKWVIKIVFQLLTKMNENRAVRNLISMNEAMEILGNENFDEETLAKIIEIFRIQGNTFILPFIYN